MKINIDSAVVAKIEALAYEYEARKSVIAEMLSQNMDISTKAFELYQKELVSYKAQFEAAKSELQKQYVDVVDGAKSWNLDYASCELTINKE